jgi:hypothetical protein
LASQTRGAAANDGIAHRDRIAKIDKRRCRKERASSARSVSAIGAAHGDEYGSNKVRHTAISKFIFLPTWSAKVGYCDEAKARAPK